MYLAASIVLAAFWAVSAEAITRAEMATALWDALDYNVPAERLLPPDVPGGHQHAAAIGSAARYALISASDPFMPDETINRHEAVRMCIEMIGWRYELSLYDSLAELPDFGASGDSVFFMAAEMTPKAPDTLLIDGSMALTETGRDSLIAWVTSCKKFVQWNRVFSYNGTELSLFRQGIARPGEPNEPGTGSPIGARECEPFYVATVAIDPAAVDTRIAFSEPFGTPRVVPSLFHAAYSPLAVVNGGFFHGGRPIGTMLLNGAHAGKPIMGRAAIGWDNASGTIVFGRGGARTGVKIGSAFAEIGKFNVNPDADEAALFNADITRSTIGSAADALMIIAENGKVTEIRDGADRDYWLPEHSIGVIARGKSRRQFEGVSTGDPVTYESAWETRAFEKCTDLIQGGPMLLRGGALATDTEGFKPEILARRHPRTIVGTDGSRVIWAVIDGRSSIHSRGATIEETQWIAKSLGMSTAINLDGGGSSQIIWRGVLANSPSDGRERPIPYSVIMLPRGTEMVWSEPADMYVPGSWNVSPLYSPSEPSSPEDEAFRELYDKMFKDKK